jgi:phage tail tape-measure protein
MASTRDDANLNRDKVVSTDANRDPITGEPGAHPVGTGVGAAAAGAAAGAAGGAVAGPAGAVAGAVIGGLAGGLAGHSIAESIDPTVEDAYWRENYKSRPYFDASTNYDYNEYQPAYRHGWESRSRYADKTFDEVEPHLQRDWESAKAHSRLSWEHAKHAARDAWDRVEDSVSRRRQDTTR